MSKYLFNSEKELVNWLFDFDKEIDGIEVESINDLAPEIGIEFMNKYDITGNIDDDGEWAGKEHYQYCGYGENLPKSYPAMLVLNILVNTNNVFDRILFIIDWVYKKEFENG